MIDTFFKQYFWTFNLLVLAAAGFLVAFGVQFYFFTVPGGEVFSLDAAQGALLTGFLVIATVNAVNFVDGLDGLAAGVVGIGALAFFLYCYQLTSINDTSRATTAALLTVALAGACAGFLPHNINPARLFMGDSGSMLIGLVLSAGAVTLTGIGQVMAEFVEFLSGGNLLAMLFFVAVISIILGMGMPTAAIYIILATVIAPALVDMGLVPIAAHLFLFYFGLVSMLTPPVAVAVGVADHQCAACLKSLYQTVDEESGCALSATS